MTSSVPNLNMPLCKRLAAEHPSPLVFATISGAHLYGFSSPDSDYDLRGAHILHPREVLSLRDGERTITAGGIREGVEIDLVTHDAEKFFRLMLKRNGYVLEQLLSPLVVQTSPEHQRLVELAPRCITRHHAHHYIGFANTQWELFAKESPPRVKPLLYVYRVLLTGIHLMRTGRIEANLVHLNAEYALPHVDELIRAKTTGVEKTRLMDIDLAMHREQFERLLRRLRDEHDQSTLPEMPSALDELSDFLVELRLAQLP